MQPFLMGKIRLQFLGVRAEKIIHIEPFKVILSKEFWGPYDKRVGPL